MSDFRLREGGAAHAELDPRLLRALAHPVRVRVLLHLHDHETASAVQLANAWNLKPGVVSYHLNRLVALRLLRLVERVPRRGAMEHRYTLVTDAVPHLAGLLSRPVRPRTTPAEIGAGLKRLRERNGTSCVQLARAVGLDVADVIAIEDGTADPSLRTLIDLADCFDASLADLVA